MALASRRVTWFALACLGLLVAPAVPVGASAADPAGDATDGDPDHDLLAVDVAETMDALRITVTVQGAIPAPVAGVEEVVLRFRVVHAALYNPAVSPQVAGTSHTVQATVEDRYGVFRAGGLGYLLPEPPVTGAATATWVVPKAYLDATAARRPLAGDWLSDVVVEARVLGAAVDSAAHPDVQLGVDAAPGTAFHLRGPTGGERRLREDAPMGSTPSTAAAGATQAPEWRSAPLERLLKLDELSAVLWLSTTASTPVLSDQDFRVDLLVEEGDGTRTVVARRIETVHPESGASTNLFLVPGAPQRMPFRLAAVEDGAKAHVGERLVLRVSVSPLFAEEAGPVLVAYNSADTDSFVLAGARAVPRPDHSACPGGNGVAELPRSQC